MFPQLLVMYVALSHHLFGKELLTRLAGCRYCELLWICVLNSFPCDVVGVIWNVTVSVPDRFTFQLSSYYNTIQYINMFISFDKLNLNCKLLYYKYMLCAESYKSKVFIASNYARELLSNMDVPTGQAPVRKTKNKIRYNTQWSRSGTFKLYEAHNQECQQQRQWSDSKNAHAV